MYFIKILHHSIKSFNDQTSAQNRLMKERHTVSAVIGVAQGFRQDNGVIDTAGGVNTEVGEYIVKHLLL